MLTLDVRGLPEIQAALRGLAEEQIPYAMMTAINSTAFKVKAALQKEMKSTFDRPTPWLIRQTWVGKATKENLVATVAAAEPREGRLERIAQGIFDVQSKGGSRLHKSGEVRLQRAGILPRGWYAVPAPDAPLDAYGNLSGQWWMIILSWLNAAQWYSQGATQNRVEKVRNRKNQLQRAGLELFPAIPNRERTWHLQPGVYARQRKGGASALKPLLLFVSKASYKPRLDWTGVAERTAREELPAAMQAAVARALKTALVV